MSMALTVVGQNQPVLYVNPKKAKYAEAKAFLASGSGNKSQFAGTHLSWNGKHGKLVEGFGDGKKNCRVNTFAVNVPNSIRMWQYWPTDAKAPTYPYLCLPFAAQSLPHRGDIDDGQTRHNKLRKKDESVWSEGLMLILRDPDTDRLYHLELYNNARNAAMSFLLGILDECESNPDHLPVVTFSTRTVKLDDGGDFEAMDMTLEGWTEVTDVDNPGALSEAVETAPEEVEEAAEDEAQVEEPAEEEAPKTRAKAAPTVDRITRATSNAPAKPAPFKASAAFVSKTGVRPVVSAKPATAKPAGAKLVGTNIKFKRPMRVADDEASAD